MDFNENDIESIDTYINHVKLKITFLIAQKDTVISLTAYYGVLKSIRKETLELERALLAYKKLEIELGLPVNLTYRSALRDLQK